MFDIISSRPDDEGFVEDPQNYKVYLNGEFLGDCESADRVLGEAVVFVRGDNGLIMFDGADVMTKKVYGDIGIVKDGC